jgi:hypothetical protein
MFVLLPKLRKIWPTGSFPKPRKTEAKSRIQQGFWTLQTRRTVYTRLSTVRKAFGPETKRLPERM